MKGGLFYGEKSAHPYFVGDYRCQFLRSTTPGWSLSTKPIEVIVPFTAGVQTIF